MTHQKIKFYLTKYSSVITVREKNFRFQRCKAINSDILISFSLYLFLPSLHATLCFFLLLYRSCFFPFCFIEGPISDRNIPSKINAWKQSKKQIITKEENLGFPEYATGALPLSCLLRCAAGCGQVVRDGHIARMKWTQDT